MKSIEVGMANGAKGGVGMKTATGDRRHGGAWRVRL
jgi:hypothetical protein